MDIVTTQEKIDLLEAAFGESSLANSGKNISVMCPSCRKDSKNSSKKRKLSICLDKGIYHCWVCETKGKNIASFVNRHTQNKVLANKLTSAFGIVDLIEKEVEEKIVKLPDDFALLYGNTTRQGSIARRYLESRGVSTDDLLKFKIGISNEYEYSNRVIFPSFCDNMKLNYYLTRTYDETQKRKYKNCNASRSDVIFNEYLIDWKKPVILVEGVFDSIKAGDNSIPMLGSWIDESHYLFKRIVKEKSDVILGMDPDAHQKELKIAKKLSEYGINVKITQNKSTDIGDMSKEEANYLIQTAKNYEISDRITYLLENIYSGSIF